MTRKLLLAAWLTGWLGIAAAMALLFEVAPPRCTDAMQMVQDCRTGVVR